MKSIIICLGCCCLLGFSGLFRENPCAIMYPREGNTNWGEGAYLLPDTVNIPLYCDVEGNIFGSIQKEYYYLRVLDSEKKELPFQTGNTEYIGSYALELIKVKSAYSEKFVEVIAYSQQSALFLKKEDLESCGARYYSYKDFLFSKEFPFTAYDFKGSIDMGVNLYEGCLNLRTGPSTNFSKIACIPGNSHKTQDHTRLKILESKGLWAKVEVRFYIYDSANDESGEGCSFKLSKTSIGWMKALDDNGFPNIWYSVSNY